MPKLEIHAGPEALTQLQQEGFQSHLFSHFLGASGGPKWFSHYALDSYLIADFFHKRETPLHFIGSSAGAFRASCFARKDPVEALENLARIYSQTCYAKGADAKQITQQTRDLIDELFAEKGAEEIINNTLYQAHFVVAKCQGLGASEQTGLQLAGMFSSYVKNRLGRQHLASQSQRFIFQPAHSKLQVSDPFKIPTQQVTLTQENIKDALLASGSIPLVMEGIANIAGAPKGMYRDGGLIDYHFDLNFHNQGLILYPHYDAKPKAGWFDKFLSRTPQASHYDKAVILCPSAEFIESFPFQKIPDRNDFKNLTDEERIPYWQKVMRMTQVLAEELDDLIQKQDINRIKPLVLV
ncbi:MAG: patatin-like phospholipase family protein [Marinomonas sp.]